MTIRRPRDELLDIEEILRQLRQGPQQIEALIGNLSPAELRARPAPGEWSINDNLAHLRASADVWGSYIARIVAEDRPSFTSVNPRARMRKTDYPDLDFAPSFRAFRKQRDALLGILEGMPRAGWARTATVKVYGDLFEYTAQHYGSKLARHEAVHVPQIESVVRLLSS
jgi:DinB superfamily